MLKKEELLHEEEKKEEKLQNHMPDGTGVSGTVSDYEDGVDDQDDYLDLDEELSKVEVEIDDDYEEVENSEADYINLGNTAYVKPVADENDYMETGALPELTAAAITEVKQKQEKKASNKKSKKKSEGKKNADKKTVNKKPVDKKPVDKKPAGKKPAVNKTTAKSESAKKEAPKKEKKKVNVPLVVGGTVLGLAVVCGGTYAGFANYFKTHYFYNTYINGKDFSMKTVDDAVAYMEKKVSGYELVLEESDGSKEKIAGADIGIEFTSANELQEILDKQENWKFYKSIQNKSEYTTSIAVTYDENKLQEVAEGLDCFDKEKQVSSKSAYPEYDEEKGEYVIHPEVIGTKLKKKKFFSNVNDAILAFEDSIDLKEKKCYYRPKYTTKSKVLKNCVKNLNKYLTAEITYEVDPLTEVCDASVIKDWLSYDDNFDVTFDESAVETYVQDLAYKLNTVENTRTFTTVDGSEATVSGGSYGWSVDKETEYYNLLENIKAGDVVSREPAYYQRAVNHSDLDWGDTYAEVNLTTQHMRYIENGEVKLEADVVTGLPGKHATPEGVYSINWMQSPSTLRGRNDDGSKYAAKVQYWMAFNYDIGFHDASWQPSFGGERYKVAGSHGCVNMPTDAAGKLYDMVSNGTPVVVHF